MTHTPPPVALIVQYFPGQWTLKAQSAQTYTDTTIMASSLFATVVKFLPENKIGKTVLI